MVEIGRMEAAPSDEAITRGPARIGDAPSEPRSNLQRGRQAFVCLSYCSQRRASRHARSEEQAERSTEKSKVLFEVPATSGRGLHVAPPM